MFGVGAAEEARSKNERGLLVTVLLPSSMVSRLVLALHHTHMEVRGREGVTRQLDSPEHCCRSECMQRGREGGGRGAAKLVYQVWSHGACQVFTSG